MKEILKLDHIQKYYGSEGGITKAIRDISFTVEEGEFLGIMGASGSGKTTLLNCISTIDTVSAGHIYLDGEDVTDAIRQHEISRYTSCVSAIPAVRDFLLERQRELARTHDVIMDGRDIGTVVLPRADVKIFLTASPEDRARRRYEELCQRGQETDYDTVLRDVIQRDEHDTKRAAAPLRQAEDALLVDTTGNSLEKSLGVLLDTIKERLHA